MQEIPLTVKEKRLKTLRKLLWICFGGISIPILLMAIPLLFMFGARAFHTEGLRAGVMLPVLGLSLLIIPAVIGVVCLVIYHIFKYRLEKEDDFFL